MVYNLNSEQIHTREGVVMDVRRSAHEICVVCEMILCLLVHYCSNTFYGCAMLWISATYAIVQCRSAN